MSNEIRRRRTASPEIDAMVVIEQACESLNFDQRKRVLGWAEDRYIGGVLQTRREEEEALDNSFTDLMGTFTQFIRGVKDVTEQMGVGMSPRKLFAACEVILTEANRIEETRALEASAKS